ncbi:MAG: shikimate dehydrogenase [Rhizobacter sp.]|nr:shikimate dehydrogenase [Chlorobiales bacterium]
MLATKKILGLLGHQISYSLSPLMHNKAAELLGLEYIYVPFDLASPERLEAALDGVRTLGIAGLNVTVPYKEKVMKYLDTLSPEAAEAEAVNTIVNQEGTLIGYNTDITGFGEPLKPYKAELKNAAVAIFGNGGAARAVIESLRNEFDVSAIHLIVRNEEKAAVLRESLERRSKNLIVEVHNIVDAKTANVLRAVKLIVNATPVGTAHVDATHHLSAVQTSAGHEELYADPSVFSAGQLVYDLTYHPPMTPLLITAAGQGATVISGLEMLLAQGAKAFELWTGHAMPVAQVRPFLVAALEAPFVEAAPVHPVESAVKKSAAKSATKVKFRKVKLDDGTAAATEPAGLNSLKQEISKNELAEKKDETEELEEGN